MNYYSVRFDSGLWTPELSELLIALLSNEGYEGFQEDPGFLLAFIPEELYKEDVLENLAASEIFNPAGLKFSSGLVVTTNWNALWEADYSPIIIANTITIRAPFHPPSNTVYTINIEPKMSFGTGHHESTRLMVMQMEKEIFKGKKVLDMGCGTGILGIFALMLEAESLTAIDIDDWAVNNSIENLRNNIKDEKAAKILKGDAGSIPDEKYDIILANINRNILLEDIPAYCKHLMEKGILILSGILTSDREAILNKAGMQGLKLEAEVVENNWISLKFSM